ncbi:isocitrate lyase/phosphoenolpyruvate mutase family protein [Streptomyces sp. PTM05]|uniref:Isocitrate lyase/phosphoenolpyruvate mutase family protein n=1 Tax=Streptantibioticus parmotrematis TaxID=2873249 RepID=A0ABS7R0K1_9ACTN|nr:isocitrate lyase/phosphoenolpyruvate mutase family protein [Streptantibioticus parmotrematis]MBY8888985.1 isocitrate lyase/phosphoenolpyruvate mutase family protein [Streptantibioticus parmotrematis]
MTFTDLHQQDSPLLLPNAWDVASALAFAEAGFPAIGTTSFGVAAASGSPDGGRASKDATLALAHKLRALPAYVSVDIEDGYSDDPEQVAAYAASLGAAGVNIEDSSAEELIDPAAHAAKIAAVKDREPHLFVNARVDTYWLGQRATVEETVERARSYVAAGADGVFVPGAADPVVLRQLTDAVTAPVNVLAHPTLTLAELADLGVRRVSTGSLPYRAAVDAAVRTATGLRDGGSPPSATSYAVMQDRLVRYDREQGTRDPAERPRP